MLKSPLSTPFAASRPLTRRKSHLKPRIRTSSSFAMSSTSSASKPLLFHRPNTASSIPFIVIEELNLKDQVDVLTCANGEHKTGEAGAHNPHGFAPLLKLEDGDYIMESGAIGLHLVEKYGGSESKLLGRPEQRPKLLQWTFYGPATFYNDIVPIWKDENVKNNKEKLEELKQGVYNKNFALIAKALSNGNEYLLGNEFTLADIVVGYNLIGLKYLGWIDAEKAPAVAAYTDRILTRPSFQRAYGSA